MLDLTLHNLQYYYNRLHTIYGDTLDSLWVTKFEVENIFNWTNDFYEMSNIRNAFVLFYIIKSKMYLDATYHWGLVLDDYDITALKLWLECNNLTLPIMIEIFDIDTTIPPEEGTGNIYSGVNSAYLYSMIDENTTYLREFKI